MLYDFSFTPSIELKNGIRHADKRKGRRQRILQNDRHPGKNKTSLEPSLSYRNLYTRNGHKIPLSKKQDLLKDY